MIALPDSFSNRIILMYGKAGEKWLHDLPEIITFAKNKWHVRIGKPFKSTVNFVAAVIFPNGTSAVLKLCMPGSQTTSEINVLRHYEGKCFCKLIDAIEDNGIILMEELKPGNNLVSIPDDKAATRIVAGLIKQMSKVLLPDGNVFSNIRGFAGDFEKMHKEGPPVLPAASIEKAIQLFAELCESQTDIHLLHGDLHHENVLLCDGKWKVIDPKGLIGETCYEIVPFLNNNLPTVDFASTIHQRIDIFAKELALDHQRIYKWGFSYSMLSAWWDIEDNLGHSAKSTTLISFYDRLT
jgi:streptomycin 6-kinase